ncbi:MAG: hypothetical protein IPP98_11760 [Gemmatimonadetes bacterium]|nr:hypothetical protein [Gemmatimonadota bacterium]MBL0179786.1 hypothetical protein [Gemmatimonadota bacterium]
MSLRPALMAAVMLLAACGGDAAKPAIDSAGLVTTIDSTADTVSANTAGDVPAAAVRTMAKEMAIAPGLDDTTLFTDVRELKVDGQGRMWVYDPGPKQILLFSPTGSLLKRIGRSGAGPGEFASDGGMAVLGDSGLAIWDSQNARITFMDSSGTYTHSWPTPGGFNTFAGLITDRAGAFFVKRPVTPPREGEILGRMGLVRLKDGGGFADSSAAPDLIVPRESYVASNKGSTSSTSSNYAPAYYWAWHPDGYFLAANGGKYEIILARKNARPLVIRRDPSPVPVGDEERDIEKAGITHNMRNVEPGWSWRGPALPSTKAPMMGLAVARDGRIWVRVAAPSAEIPVADRAIPEDSLAPVIKHQTPSVYEVFEPSGRFLGRVAFPPKARFAEAQGDLVWAIVRDADDVPSVVRFKVVPGFK